MASQRTGATALLRLDRSRASASPQTTTHNSATNISIKFVWNPFHTSGRLSLNASQLRKVLKNCSMPVLPSGADERDVSRVTAEVLLQQIADEALRLQGRDDLVERLQVGRALVEDGAVLLAGLELAGHLPVLDLVGLDRAEHDGRVEHDGVDLPGVQGGERVNRRVVDLGLGVRLDGLVDEVQPGGVGLGAPAQLLGVGHA